MAGTAFYAIHGSTCQTLLGFPMGDLTTKMIVDDSPVVSATISEPELHDSERVLNVVHEFGGSGPESR